MGQRNIPRTGRDPTVATASINLPLYQVLRFLNVPEDAAASAAEAPPVPSVDLSHLATRDELRFEIARLATRDELRTELARFATHDELRAEIAGVRTEIAGVRTEIAQALQRQTIWIIGAILTIAGLGVALLRVFPAK